MGKCRSLWRPFPFVKLIKTFRRSPIFKRALILASACVVYLIFVASHVGNSHDRTRAHNDKSEQQARGLYRVGGGEAIPSAAVAVAPTRPNIVYITLKAKRQKPANIRGTVRPKLRRKTKTHRPGTLAFTHDRLGTLEVDANQTKRDVALHTSWRMNYENVDAFNISDSVSSTIRIYSQKPPPWFTPKDVLAMRFLADAKVLRISRAPPSVLMFEGEPSDTSPLQKLTKWDKSRPMCGEQCGFVYSPVETSEVFAFHLDRVLGLNRTLPAVSRKFQFIHNNQPCPVVLWDSSPYSSVNMTWGQYQRSLKLKCWLKMTPPGFDPDCSSIHHREWSKLALFDFLLQIHRRLDPHCCGFRARVQDECGSSVCSRQDNTKLEHLTYREEDPRHLVFTHNRGYFDRNEDSLDFRLLEGIREFPVEAVAVLRGGRLRERLLQSLFIDQTYWESQGGRQGIDTLIDVIERRAKVLLTYINAHGISLTPMSL